MTGLTEQDEANRRPFPMLCCGHHTCQQYVAQIRARAVAETAERIAVAIERECNCSACHRAARIARAKAGR